MDEETPDNPDTPDKVKHVKCCWPWPMAEWQYKNAGYHHHDCKIGAKLRKKFREEHDDGN